MNNPVKKPRWVGARRVVQATALVVFVVLTVAGFSRMIPWLPETVFPRFDPLIGLAAMLASRTLLAFGAAAIGTVVLTVAFGRAWCGWICPVGTLLDTVPASRKQPGWLTDRWRLGSYITLAVVLGAAAFGTLSPMILDPVTIATRPLQEFVMPLLGSDAVGRATRIATVRAGSAGMLVAVLSVVPLALVLGLNTLGRRTWCRMLCPLGGLLALITRLPGLRRVVDAGTCTSCARCAVACPTGAVNRAEEYAVTATECTVCMQCVDVCPTGAAVFRTSPIRPASSALELDRRDALLVAGATGVSLLATAVAPAFGSEDGIVRPPATDERRLAELCVRCGACYAACPTGALRPSLSFASVAGPWTPMLDQRPAHCSLSCNLCATVCPTDAIHTHTFEEELLLGLYVIAHVDRANCRAWGRGKRCLQCLAACPIRGALVSVEDPMKGQPRRESLLRVPVVDPELCIACNLCAGACPIAPAAIGTHVPRNSDQV
ncbi:MAG: 4Fe-4S binding protein [Actinomycetota bacterium]|nr:4Fe-4S binding protein [Actinomycetota bacterium]